VYLSRDQKQANVCFHLTPLRCAAQVKCKPLGGLLPYITKGIG